MKWKHIKQKAWQNTKQKNKETATGLKPTITWFANEHSTKLAKWLRLCSQTKWLWVQVPLQSLKFQIYMLVLNKEFLDIQVITKCRFTLNMYVAWWKHIEKKKSFMEKMNLVRRCFPWNNFIKYEKYRILTQMQECCKPNLFSYKEETFFLFNLIIWSICTLQSTYHQINLCVRERSYGGGT